MRIKINKIQSILYLGIFTFVLKTFFERVGIFSDIAIVDNVLIFISLACWFLHMLQGKLTYKMFGIYIVSVLILLYNCYVTRNFSLVITGITCLVIYNEDINKVVKFIFWISFLLFVLHTIWVMIGIIIWDESYFSIIYDVKRIHMGFTHPNGFSIYAYNLMLMWIWINFKRINSKHIAILLLLDIFLFTLTKTRTSLITSLLVLALLAVYKSENIRLQNLFNKVARYIVPTMFVITMILVFLYTKGSLIVIAIDDILSARIRLGAYAYSNYGFSLFGQYVPLGEVQWDTTWLLSIFTFDNTYTFLAFNIGLIWIVIISIGMYKLSILNNPKVNIMIISWALYGITEVHGLNLYMCFPIMLLTVLFAKNNTKKELI